METSLTAQEVLIPVKSGKIGAEAPKTKKPRRYTDRVFVYHRFDHEPFHHHPDPRNRKKPRKRVVKKKKPS